MGNARIGSLLLAATSAFCVPSMATAASSASLGVVAGGLLLVTPLQTCSVPQWSGTPGTTANVILNNLGSSATQWGCIGGCTGSSSSARVYFAPSASLVNAGNADVPWLDWLGSGNASPLPPYGNRQHPLLVWNLFRVDQAGRLEQIGRSGVKHAWYTVNSSCGCSGGNVLWAAPNTPNQVGCSDTYSAGNNNESRRLGPRSEIVPRRATWGRCGSVWDPACNGVATDPGIGPPAHRMLVRESDLAPAANPGAEYFLEAWYLVRDDADGSDNLRHARGTTTWNGSSWSAFAYAAGSHVAGAVIDAWVSPQSANGTALNRSLSTEEGTARLAVRVSALGDGRHRYDYAVMNLDYARAQTIGSEPNLRVVHNRGFDRFSIPIDAGVQISDIEMADGAGLLTAWDAVRDAQGLTWAAPSPSATLDWGTLLRFSFVADLAPLPAQSQLRVYEAGTPQAHLLETLVPATLFRNGFE